MSVYHHPKNVSAGSLCVDHFETLPGMAVNDLHLAVEIGAWWTAAVYACGNTTQPLYFDGQPRLPSGIYQSESGGLLTGVPALTAGMNDPAGYQPHPMATLQTPAAPDGDIDPLAAVADVLAHVANLAAGQTGSPVTALTLITDRAWGPRARQRLQQAAISAGLPDPHVVTAAAAAASVVQSGTEGPGPYVAVGTGGLEMAILDCVTGYHQLAHLPIHDSSAESIDRALAQVAAERAAADSEVLLGDWRVMREIRLARSSLADQPRTSILLPEPYQAVLLTRSDIHAAAAPYFDDIEETVKQLVAEAELEVSEIGAVVLVGDDAVIPELEAALTTAGLPLAVVLRDPHVISYGALQLTQPLYAASRGTAATVRLPRTRLTLANLARVAVLAACSVALLWQTIETAITWKTGSTVTAVYLPRENIAFAAALAALTGWAAAQLTPTTWILSSHADDNITTGALLRRGYLGAASLSLALAGLWGLGIGIGVHYTPDPYIKITILTAAPFAAAAAIIALTAHRIPASALPSWLQRVSPPAPAIALAAAGVFVEQLAFSTSPTYLFDMAGLFQSAGAAMLGAGTAFTATRQPLLRGIAAVILGSGYALVTGFFTARYLTIAYIGVLIWWAIITTAATVMASTSLGGWLRRWLTPPE
ncbi:Hsp70 family protein [Actinoplanes sp. L3-i22]|uniref:Hsp70 family protein n=1 Tax=Actinoplanes sp. L3-i22 TaxID=2836373 RepID=UPI001C749298|nr:Hsp70 family protein [Actinoplanes sp. L3-i22]BCY07344.1 hypothetical protein L3i22_024320 [Actinoplanes sp. L3-i22]